MIFVDTGAWFALFVAWDANHPSAIRWHRSNRELLLTTDYVIDETLTLMRARSENNRAIEFGDQMLAGNLSDLHRISADEFRRAWEIFSKFPDKQWSFTDCTSKVIIEKLRIRVAVSFDHHFRQFGSVTVVP